MNVSIRNIALASGLTLVSLLGLSSNAQAQTTGATNLKVTIAADCKFVVVPTGLDESAINYAAITLKSSQTPLTVSCNGNSFTVNAKSTNAGKLVASGIATTIPYTVLTEASTGTTGSTFFTPAATLPSTDTPILVKTGYTTTCASTTGCSALLTWALGTPLAGLPIGVYTDTITYTLSAN